MNAGIHVTLARPRALATAIRASIAVFATVAVLLLPHPGAGLIVLTAVGTLLAITLPAHAGAVFVLGAVVLGWVVGYGTDASPPLPRTVCFAVAVYLVHAATALAASVPVQAEVSGDVAVSWAVRCVPRVAAAVIVAVGVGLVGHAHGSLVLDVAGLLGVVVTAGAAVWLAGRLD